MNVAQAIVGCLEQFGVNRAYGLIGTSILDLVDATKDSKIRYISTRHEQVATWAFASFMEDQVFSIH